jgi:hypothetical protein
MVKNLHDHSDLRLIALNSDFLEVAMLHGTILGYMHGYLRRSIAKSLCIVNVASSVQFPVSGPLANFFKRPM